MAQMQHADPVGNVFHHGKVMGDEQIGGAGFLLKILHQVNHLRLNGNIQRTDALVGNDQLWIHDQGTGNAHALTLAAGELVGITIRMLRGQTHLFQNRCHLLLPLGAAGIQMMNVQTLGNDLPHLFAGVQAGHGILKDHLHLGAQLLVLLGVQIAGNIHPVEQNLPGGGLVQADHAAADGALAAAALAHQTVGFARVDYEVHTVHRLHGELVAALEILLQTLDFQKGCSFFHCQIPSFFMRSMRAFSSGGISTLGARSSSSQVAA